MADPISTHGDCPDCDGTGCLSTWDDHTFCHSCNKHRWTSGKEAPKKAALAVKSGNPDKLKCIELTDRGISKEVAELYGVKAEVSESTGEVVKHYYPYYKDGRLIAHKVRNVAGKEFYATGKLKDTELFGQGLVSGGKLLIITEGECDAMAAKQMLMEQGKNYSVVSIPTGATSSKKSIQGNLEFISKFENVTLAFDNDAAGLKGVETILPLFDIGQVKVCRLPRKDPNDMLKEGMSKEFLYCVYNAQVHRPDGIVDMSESWDAMFENEDVMSIPYPWDDLNGKTYGLRPREIVTITAGSGVGKSQICRELEHYLLKTTDDNIGILALEESIEQTGWGLMAIEANKPYGIREERKQASKEYARELFDSTIGTGRVFTLDHFGSTDEESLLSRVKYMIKGLDCKWIFLDHLSIVVSGMQGDGVDERKTIDNVMTKLRQLTEETGAGLILVSHLRRAGGDVGHEQGLEVSLSHLRGSQAIAQLSDIVIAAERNQQEDDIIGANTTTLRVLKNRYSGVVGVSTKLYYDRLTGRMVELNKQGGGVVVVEHKEEEDF